MSAIAQCGDEIRERVTLRVMNIFDGDDQRFLPTFVTAVGGVLNKAYESGEMRLSEDATADDLEYLFGNVYIFWFVLQLAIDSDDFITLIKANCIAFDFSEVQTEGWLCEFRERLKESDKTKRLQKLAYYLSRNVQHIAGMKQRNPLMEEYFWMMKLGDIHEAYVGMMENPNWIRELDLVLKKLR